MQINVIGFPPAKPINCNASYAIEWSVGIYGKKYQTLLK